MQCNYMYRLLYNSERCAVDHRTTQAADAERQDRQADETHLGINECRPTEDQLALQDSNTCQDNTRILTMIYPSFNSE